MKIQGQPPASRTEAVQHARQAGGAERTREPSEAAQVKVSGAAQRLADARSPERPDPARVERLRSMIERGEFQVHPDRIADAMLREEK